MTRTRKHAGLALPSTLAAAAVFGGLVVMQLGTAPTAPGPTWVGLYDDAQLGWLENENRLRELCPDAGGLDACYARVLAPRVTVHHLYAAPDSASRSIGDLVVVATPGRGLTAHFRAADAAEAVSFVPDLFLQDWGYGPYFHQTAAGRTGTWFRLPRHPWPEPVWLHRPAEAARPSIITVSPGDLVAFDGTGWYVVTVSGAGLVLRAEQPADHWCEEGAPPPLAPAEAVSIAYDRLYDANGHLLVRPTYLKGC